jgi:glycosyltransferase involved in cell wall biosynthesis
MKLSVIIPVYNRAGMIRDTIASVVDCGLDDLEIVIVDDGSTDQTAEVVGALGSHVRYLRQSNAGPAAARNTGFAASRGQYVAFLDSDDHWLPGAVPKLVRLLDLHQDISLIFGDALMGSPGDVFVSLVQRFCGDAIGTLPARELAPGVRRFERGPFFRQLLRRNFVFLGSLVVRREAVEQAGQFDETLFGTEDWEFVLRLAMHYEYTYCVGLSVAAYHQHASNLTRDQDRMNFGFCKALERLLEKPGLGPDERGHVLSHLKRCRWGYAYPAYDRGDFHAASQRFYDCLRTGFAWKPFFYWLACQLPAPVLTRARMLKQTYSG